MASARPLRDVFADLAGAPGATGDPAGLLGEHGHPGLPADLVAEAVVSYAETAPLEVAEHLAPYVTAHSPVAADPELIDEPEAGWLDLLGTAPTPDGEPDDPDAAGLDTDTGLDFGAGAPSPVDAEPATITQDSDQDDLAEFPDTDLTADDFHADDFQADDFDTDDFDDDDGELDDTPLG